MKVAWIGMDDSKGCVLQWHELRLHLRDEYGVDLVGDGYSEHKTLSEVERDLKPDWIVLDDCNAMGYPSIKSDCRPDCRIAWREHDWHNRNRTAVAATLEPDLILACVDRPWTPDDTFRTHDGWRLIPHPVNVHRFYPTDESRPVTIGLYGKTGRVYGSRTKAREELLGRPDAWIGTHGGYWRDGRGSKAGVTYYNDELAEQLRKVRFLWVDGSDYGVFLQKYHEGIASSCVLIGKEPFAWESYYPPNFLPLVCEPYELNEVLARADDTDFSGVVEDARVYCVEHHSIEARAKQIMEVLECATSA